MIFIIHISNLPTISLVVSETICLTKIDTDDRQTADLFFCTLEVMTTLQNMELSSYPMDSITILP